MNKPGNRDGRERADIAIELANDKPLLEAIKEVAAINAAQRAEINRKPGKPSILDRFKASISDKNYEEFVDKFGVKKDPAKGSAITPGESVYQVGSTTTCTVVSVDGDQVTIDVGNNKLQTVNARNIANLAMAESVAGQKRQNRNKQSRFN